MGWGYICASFRERLWPYVLAAAVTYGYHSFCGWAHMSIVVKNPRELFSTAASIAGVAAAFIATIQGILFAIKDSVIIKQLQALKRYNQLLDYFSAATGWAFAVMGLSVGGYFIDFSTSAPWEDWFFLAWIFSCMTSGGVSLRVIRLFNTLLRD